MYSSSPKKPRIGVYGGSFNPIHMGHTAMAVEMLRRGLVDEMWLVVSPRNPLKHDGLWDDAFRLSLARAAAEGLPGVSVCDVEFSLPRPNYMITTLETLSLSYPGHEFVLVIGMDNWECFHRWHRSEEILRRYPLVVLPRRSDGSAPAAGGMDAGMGDVTFPDIPLIDLSSTWIRSQINDNPAYGGEGLDPRVWAMIKDRYR